MGDTWRKRCVRRVNELNISTQACEARELESEQSHQSVLYLRVVSARSSFFLLIRSFRPSASLLAAVILACIASLLMSADIVNGCVRQDGERESSD